MSEASSLLVPQFLKAASPNGLVRLMLQNNLKRHTQFEYQIIHDGKSWFAWYYFKQDFKEAITDAVQTSNQR